MAPRTPASRFRRSLWTFAAIAVTSIPASAQITDLPAVDGIGRFLDTRTGFVWIDFAHYYSLDYGDQVDGLPAGFRPATLLEVEALTQLSMPLVNPSEFAYYFDVVGAANTQGRRIIWGNYEVGAGSNGWYWAFEGEQAWSTFAGPGPEGELDLGIWALSTDVSAVPEPASMTLLATGLVGVFAVARRRRKV